MKKSLLMFASVVLLSGPAMAQEEVTSLLVPSGAWLVGPTTLDDGSPAENGMPCVMVNKFSNNIEMRLSGGGQELMAMALTFDEKAFQKDQSYLMSISFPDQEAIKLPAQAFSETTLVVGTEPGKDIYKSLQTAGSMTIGLGASNMEFSLLGVPQGLKRMESCFSPTGAVTAAAEQPVPPAPTPGVRTLDEKPAVEQKIAEAPATTAAPAAPMPDSKLDELISKASESTLPAVPAEVQPKVSKKDDEPKPEPEVAAIKPKVKPAPAPAPVPEVKSQDIIIPGTTASVTGEGQQMRWRVMKGANLQSILEVWAQSAQARLVWNAGQGFSVPESVVMQGTFEEVVETVLSQYTPGQVRPMGKIYIDPVMKQKVLVIEADSPPVPTTAEGNYAPIGSPQL